MVPHCWNVLGDNWEPDGDFKKSNVIKFTVKKDGSSRVEKVLDCQSFVGEAMSTRS